jgi:hypothetical protein
VDIASRSSGSRSTSHSNHRQRELVSPLLVLSRHSCLVNQTVLCTFPLSLAGGAMWRYITDITSPLVYCLSFGALLDAGRSGYQHCHHIQHQHHNYRHSTIAFTSETYPEATIQDSSIKMHHIKTQEMIKPREMQQMTAKSTEMGREEEPSPTWTSTSSCDAARLVAFAVAESALLDSEADEGYPFHSFSSSYSKNREFSFQCLSFVPYPLAIPSLIRSPDLCHFGEEDTEMLIPLFCA